MFSGDERTARWNVVSYKNMAFAWKKNTKEQKTDH